MNYEDFKKLEKDAAIKAAAEFVGVEPSVIDGLWRTESGRGANKGPSRAGAMGDFQIMPGTQARFEQRFGRKFDANDFHDSLFMAAAHLKDDVTREGGDVRSALRAYNNGPNWREKQDPTGENAAYADKVLGAGTAPTAPVAARVTNSPLTLDSAMPGKLDPLPPTSAGSKRLDELEQFGREQPPRPLIEQQAVSNAPVVAADAAVLAERKEVEETTFVDQMRAAAPHQGIIGALVRNAAEDEYAPVAGYAVDPAELEGYSLDEQAEILEDGGTSPQATAQVKARIAIRREDMKVVARHGGLRAFGAQMAVGLPEGLATGVGMAKTFALAGAGSTALAAQGARGAAAASAVAENVGGNLLAAAIEDALGGRFQGHDYALAAALGLAVSPLQIKSSWAQATEAELMRQKNEALLRSAAEAQRLYNEAGRRLGPNATPEQVAQEVARLETEGVKAQINEAVGPVRNDRRLLSEDLANPYEAAEPTPASADMTLGGAKPLGKTEANPQENPAYFSTTGSMQVRTYLAGNDPDWKANIADLTEGSSLADAQKLGPGVHIRPFLMGDARLRPTVNAIKDLAAQLLPDSTIVVGVGKASRLGENVNGAVISAGKTHFIGLSSKPTPTNALLTGVHELGHAIFHEKFPDIPKPLLDRMVNEFQQFVVEARAGSAKARFRRFAEGSTNVTDDGETMKGALDLSDKKKQGYALSFDEFTAEAFVRYVQRKATGRAKGQALELDKGVVGLLKSLWASIKSLYERAMSRGYLPKDEAFDEFFERILTGTLKDQPLPKKLPKESEEYLAPELVANFNREVPEPANYNQSAANLATDPLAEKYGFNLMPAATPQEAAEAKAVRALWERATNPEADWNKADYDAKLSKLLKNNVFSNTSSTMLRSANPVMRMLAYELLENPAGAAGRRSTAALSKFITERAIMGNAINDLQMQYAKYRAAQGGSVVRDFTDGQLWERFNREVAVEIEARRMGAAGSDSEAVRLAADTLEAAYERSRLHQVNAKTIGWGSLPESSKGYMPHKLSPAKLRNMTNAQKQVLHSALVDQFQSIEGFDPSFSARLASKYIDRVESRAVGDYGTPVNIHQVGAAEVVEDALTAMGMSRPEVLAMMQRYMRGGASHTKARLKLDLLAEHDAGDGTTFRLLDLFETNQLNLLRSQAQRVSGEVALARHGIMGRPGLTLMRRAATFGEDGGKATDRELEALDQVSAEFLGAPFGTAAGKWADRAIQTTALARLGGMGFTQFAEYLNGVVPLGVSRVMAGVAGMPRLIGEARKLARGEKVDNPILSSLEHEAAEFGTDSYKLVFPFDNPDLQYQLYGADTVTFADRVLRAGAHLQGKLSFWRAIHSAQQRGMAEQIVLKAVKYIRDGKQSKALADMGFTPEVSAQLKAQLDRFVEFDGDRVRSLDVTKLDPALANEFIQAVHRGSAQIIQGTFIGETGPWVHNGMLRLLTQFRSFSITSIEKQWGRNVNNYGGMAALGILMGSMAFAAPIYIARTVVTSYGREDREKYLEEALAFERVARASMNYVAMSGLAGDFLDAASTLTGLGKSTGGRTGQATDFVGNVVAPSAGLANDLWKALQNTKDGTDVHELLRHMPFSKVPAVGWAVNALD